LAATGSNSTEKAIAFTRAAQTAGADAALVVVPYYNKPTQRGIVAHIEAVTRAVDLPILVHNVPSRTVVDLTSDTLARLAAIPGVVGIIDESGDPARPLATALAAGNRFLQLCGEDASAVSFNLAGGRGCVSVAANLAPRLCAVLHAACAADDWRLARRIQALLAPLSKVLTLEPSAATVKHALASRFGWNACTRLPLAPVAGPTALAIEQALSELEAAAADVVPKVVQPLGEWAAAVSKGGTGRSSDALTRRRG
jgi:4-hydroxy-tetrahydrodipicolinate synthase